jgi:hypothetical protein
MTVELTIEYTAVRTITALRIKTQLNHSSIGGLRLLKEAVCAAANTATQRG